jgi:hypothetical protein
MHIRYYPVNAIQLKTNGNIYIVGIKEKATLWASVGFSTFVKTRFRASILTLDNKLNYVSEKRLNFKNVDGISFPFFTGGEIFFQLSLFVVGNYFPNQFKIIKWNNEVVGFCPKKNQRYVLYKLDVDLANASISNVKEFIKIDKEADKKISKVDYRYQFSSDSNYLCIICKYRFVHSYNERLSVWVYAKNFQLKYHTDFLFNKGINNSSLTSFNVSNYGEVLLTKTFLKKSQKIRFDSTESIFIDASNLKPIRETIEFNDELIINPFIKFNKSQSPLLMGLYSDSKKVKGLFSSNFREDMTLGKIKYIPFSKFKKSSMDDNSTHDLSENSSTNNLDKDLVFNEFFQTDDSCYLSISYYYKFKLNYTHINNFTDEFTRYETRKNEYINHDGYKHIMGNFVITKLDKKKNPIWITEVNRNLLECSYSLYPTSYSSYFRFIKNGKLNMMYADNLTDEGKKSRNPFWRKNYTRVAEIDLKTGVVEINNLFNDQMHKKYVVLPSKIFRINNKQVLMLAYKKSLQLEQIDGTNYKLKSILFDIEDSKQK